MDVEVKTFPKEVCILGMEKITFDNLQTFLLLYYAFICTLMHTY